MANFFAMVLSHHGKEFHSSVYLMSGLAQHILSLEVKEKMAPLHPPFCCHLHHPPFVATTFSTSAPLSAAAAAA